ncbi:MAG: glycoside hydrolase family 2 protein, partial [Chitinophagales bacterium]
EQYDCYLLADSNPTQSLKAIVEVWQTDKGLLSADTIAMKSAADSSFIFYTCNKHVYTDKTKKVIRIKLLDGERLIANYFKYLVAPKDLHLKIPELNINYDKDSGMLTLRSDVFIAGLYLYTENSELMLSDNFFDMVPGEIITIQLENKEKYHGEKILYQSLNTIRK